MPWDTPCIQRAGRVRVPNALPVNLPKHEFPQFRAMGPFGSLPLFISYTFSLDCLYSEHGSHLVCIMVYSCICGVWFLYCYNVRLPYVSCETLYRIDVPRNVPG